MKTFKIHSVHLSPEWPAPWTSRDYWVAHELGEALHRAGARMVIGDADIDIWMWGWIETAVNPRDNNIMFVFGHPAMLVDMLAERRDEMSDAFAKWFVASSKFSEHLKERFGLDTELALLPGPSRPSISYEPTYDLAHVGNIDPRKRRKVLATSLRSHSSIVYGRGWDSLLGRHAGDYVHWSKLGEVWNSARIVLHSAHVDMVRWGFTADAVLDAITNSEALVLADSLPKSNPGHWQTGPALRAAVEECLADPTLLRERALTQRSLLSDLDNYDVLAQRFLECA